MFPKMYKDTMLEIRCGSPMWIKLAVTKVDYVATGAYMAPFCRSMFVSVILPNLINIQNATPTLATNNSNVMGFMFIYNPA